MFSVYGQESQFKLNDKVLTDLVDVIFREIHNDSEFPCEYITLSNFRAFFSNYENKSLKVSVFQRDTAKIGTIEDLDPYLTASMNTTSRTFSIRSTSSISEAPEPQPSQLSQFFTAIKNRYYINGPKRIWLTLWALGALYFFISTFISFYNKTGTLGAPIAKGSAAVINYCFGIMFALVTKSLTTILRKIGLAKLLPLNFYLYFHTILGLVTLIAAWAHSLAHILSFLRTLSEMSSVEDLNSMLVTPLDEVKSYSWWLFRSMPGLTGLIALPLLTLMTILSLKRLRCKNYERFAYVHRLWLALVILLCLHGCCQYLGTSKFLYWVIVPTGILLLEKACTLVSYLRKEHKIVSLQYLESETIELKVTKPKGYKFSPGQFVQINIPEISNLQWHPFSFSSSRNDEHLTFHISPVGDWTKELKKLALQYQANQTVKFPSIYLKGPYGAPSQHYNDYKHLMVISTGVGATPFASILRHLSHKIKADSEAGVKTKSITFYWVNRKPSSHCWLNGLIRELQADEVTRELTLSLREKKA